MMWPQRPWWLWWTVPVDRSPEPEPPKEVTPEELVRAWDEHLESTRFVAERAAQNVEDAERLTADLKTLLADRMQSDSHGLALPPE